MRLLDLDGDGLGNMDRSLKASSVAPVPGDFSTQVSAASITLGQSVTDLATLAGPNGPVSGNVSFFVCGPNLVSNPDCSSGGSAVGSAVGLAGGQATSPAVHADAARQVLLPRPVRPDMFAQYSPGEHTNLTTECFEAMRSSRCRHAPRDQAGGQRQRRHGCRRRTSRSRQREQPEPGQLGGRGGARHVDRIDAGTYSVTRGRAPAGYAADRVARVAAARSRRARPKTCTITNDDSRAPKLIVIKHVINDDGGGQGAGDFTMTVNDPGTDPASFTGAEAPGTRSDRRRRVQRHRERGTAGYAAT